MIYGSVTNLLSGCLGDVWIGRVWGHGTPRELMQDISIAWKSATGQLTASGSVIRNVTEWRGDGNVVNQIGCGLLPLLGALGGLL